MACRLGSKGIGLQGGSCIMLKDKKRENSEVLNRVIHIYRLMLRTERSWGGGGGRGCH